MKKIDDILKNKNFKNNHNYFKNLKIEKKYFSGDISKIISVFIEKLIIIILWLLINFFIIKIWIDFYINNKEYIVVITSFFLINYLLYYFFINWSNNILYNELYILKNMYKNWKYEYKVVFILFKVLSLSYILYFIFFFFWSKNYSDYMNFLQVKIVILNSKIGLYSIIIKENIEGLGSSHLCKSMKNFWKNN